MEKWRKNSRCRPHNPHLHVNRRWEKLPISSPSSVTCSWPHAVTSSPTSREQWRQRLCVSLVPLKPPDPPPITPTSSSLLLGLPLDAAVETNWQWWRVTRTIVDYTSQDKHVSTYDNQHQCAATQRPWAVQSGHKGSTSCYQISHPHQGTICLVCSVRTVWETLLLQLLSYFAHRIWQ